MLRIRYVGVLTCMLFSASCGSATPVSQGASITPRASGPDLTSGYKKANWAPNVTTSYSNGKLRYVSNGIPNHTRQTEYALPNRGVRVPTAQTAYAGSDPTSSQKYDFSIPLNPAKAASATATNLGVIGVLISGASLFNPYEGDAKTIAKQSNFSVKNSAGNDVWFLDSCNGHPTPMGEYHYHALPTCVTAQIDKPGGPSHILGIAFDGYPIYGNQDMNGKQLSASELDVCNGITSATPEFPEGVYHYVLLDTADATSSIRCFSGVVDSSLAKILHQMPGM